VHTPIDDQLLEDAARYRLRFTCEHCAHFVPESGGCADGFPNDVHRSRPLGAGEQLTFCKHFELA
jgi:hypothetical protein